MYPLNAKTAKPSELTVFVATRVILGKVYDWFKLKNCAEKIRTFVIEYTRVSYKLTKPLLENEPKNFSSSSYSTVKWFLLYLMQGLCVAAEQEGEKFLPDAIVWDSCPGPRPRVTLPR